MFPCMCLPDLHSNTSTSCWDILKQKNIVKLMVVLKMKSEDYQKYLGLIQGTQRWYV